MRFFIPIVAFALILSIVFADLLSYSRNTLKAHPDWISAKRLTVNPLMGASNSFHSRNLLYRNRLNMQEWHGHNEILLNRFFQPQLMRFRLYVGSNAYLLALFNMTSQSFSGIRLSRYPGLPSMFFRADRVGGFLVKKPFTNFALSETWHQADIHFRTDSIKVLCDGKFIQSFQEPQSSTQVVGFGSGQNAVLVDDVDVVDVSGRTVIRENFRNHCTDVRSLLMVFVLLVLLTGIVFWLSNDKKRAFLRIAIFEFSLFNVLVLYYGFDYFYWSMKYHSGMFRQAQKVAYEDSVEPLEKLRIRFFTKFPFRDFCRPKYNFLSSKALVQFLKLSPIKQPGSQNLMVIRNGSGPSPIAIADNREALESYLRRFPFADGKRILFLGTSQMWGGGAMLPQDRIADRTFGLLNHDAPNRIAVINASESGSTSHELLRRCESHLYLFRPHLVLVDLSTNDSMSDFREGLESLYEWARSLHSSMIFILEPNSSEVGSMQAVGNHAIMRQVSKELGIPLLDLHSYLARSDVFDSGILWWDFVHMAPYGQKLAAEFIADSIRKHMAISGDELDSSEARR